jgi:hypothetical protein
MKSAVEWMEDTIDKKHMGEYLQSVINQAKKMEKEEKHAEYMRGWKDGYSCKSIKNKIK